jgi:hypothetical protein
MKIKAFIGMVIICMIGTITVQGQQKDVKGWREAKWGMTENEILITFKGEAVRLEKIEEYSSWYAPIGIIDYEIAGDKYKVHFLIDKDKKVLQQVNIIADEGFKEIRYKKLEQILTEKYGTPSFKNSDKNESKIAWNFPSTIIELTYIHMKPVIENLTVIYHPPKESRKI